MGHTDYNYADSCKKADIPDVKTQKIDFMLKQSLFYRYLIVPIQDKLSTDR